jgi:hypothetical protein
MLFFNFFLKCVVIIIKNFSNKKFFFDLQSISLITIYPKDYNYWYCEANLEDGIGN